MEKQYEVEVVVGESGLIMLSNTEPERESDIRKRMVGMPAAAIDAAVKFTAPARAAWRRETVTMMVMKHVNEVTMSVEAFCMLLLDRAGVGGRLGVEGSSDARVPALKGIPGKHSKVARPWNAAIESAIRKHAPKFTEGDVLDKMVELGGQEELRMFVRSYAWSRYSNPGEDKALADSYAELFAALCDEPLAEDNKDTDVSELTVPDGLLVEPTFPRLDPLPSIEA